MAINEDEPIATTNCSWKPCGAKVNYRTSKNGLVSYTCRGEYEPSACRQHFRMGQLESQEFLQKIAQMNEDTANDNEEITRPEPVAKPARNPTKRTTAANDNEAKKPDRERAKTGTSDDGGWSL